MARTAVVAGTATAVSNRVSRRQAGRWAEQDEAQAGTRVDPQTGDSPIERLRELGELRDRGILTEEEFADQKARILAG